MTEIICFSSCLSKMLTLWATLSTYGIISDNPADNVVRYFPNLSITNTSDCRTILIPKYKVSTIIPINKIVTRFDRMILINLYFINY